MHSADNAHETRLTHKHGWDVKDAKTLKSDMTVMKNRKVEMLKTVNRFHDLFEQFKLSNGQLLTADNIVIYTGSRAFVDASIPGLVESKSMTHIDLLHLDVLPSHLIIIGGGYVGVEFAQAYRRFGAEVTVIQRREQILPKEDNNVVARLTGILEREGIRFLTNTAVEPVSGLSGQSVTLKLKSTNGAALMETSVQGSHILVASGRLPNTEDLDFDKAGLKMTASGHAVVDEQLRTAIPGVYAAGDCAGSPYFTNIGWGDFWVVFGNITGSLRPEGTRGRQVPSVMFTTPELAQIRPREKEAKAKGIEYRLVKASMGSTFLRTHTLDPVETEGFAKALLAKDSDQILGFVALAPNAGELLPVVSLTMKNGLGYQEIRDLIFAHPTLNEGLPIVFLGVPPRE